VQQPLRRPSLVYSYGGTQDRQLDLTVDRIADVFPDEQAISDAGFSSQDSSDLLAVLGPRLVGSPASQPGAFLTGHGRPTFQQLALRTGGCGRRAGVTTTTVTAPAPPNQRGPVSASSAPTVLLLRP
jgi:hypothetical protein